MPTEICRYIRINGARCGSPALTGRNLCYHHIRLARHHTSIAHQPDGIQTILHPMISEDMQRNPQVIEYFKGTGPHTLDFPPLEDRESIQIAISMLITAMAQNRIEVKRGTSILYGLQVASSNARGLNHEPAPSLVVRDTVIDADGQQIAPDEETEVELASQAILAELDRQEAEEAAEEDEDEDDE
jgi:hypothetical protein